MNSSKKLAVAVAVLAATTSLASGFRLEGQSARAVGMSTAVTALIDDSSAIYYNPAGLAGRKGLEVQAGINLIIPSLAFTSDNTAATTWVNTKLSTPFNLYASYGILEQLSLGVGFFVPFGSSASWPEDWEGSGRALTSSVQVFDINPTLAWQVHPRFRIAAGFQVFLGSVYIERGMNFVDSMGKVQLGGSATGFGWNAGFQLEVYEERLFLGGSYRSGAPMAFAGSAHFADVPLEFQARLKDQPISADLTLPDVATVGIGIKASKQLRVGLDVTAVTWATFKELKIEFEDPALTNPLPKKWDSTAAISVGGEYDVNEQWRARMGFGFDPTGTPSNTLTPDLPDATKFRFSAGAGWKSSFGLFADLAYQFVFLVPIKSTAPGFGGTYAGSAQVIALNVGYKM
ncbi:MAG: outer membrane protein transport protein [Myxococcales bacterium]|nr:outer membrane protein transport protein [Myxococcales bacterium]